MSAAFPRRPNPTSRYPAVTLALAGMLAALAGCSALTKVTTRNDPNRPSLTAARSALAEGEGATALGIARGVLSMEPRNVAAMVSAGDADDALGNHRAAENDYRAALRIDPTMVAAQLGLAKLTMRDDAKTAEGLFRTILARSPHDAAVLTDLGVALDLQDRHTEAQAMYAQAMATSADLTSTRVDLALSLALSGDPIKAEGMLRDAAEGAAVPPKVRADFALAEVLAGHADEAQTTLLADLTADEARTSVEGMSALMPAKK